MTDTPREPDNREHPDQGEFPHSQADTPVRTDDGEPSRLSASPHKQQPPPDSPDTDLVLGDATGVVLTFSSTHGFIHTDRFGSIFVHTSGLGDGTTRLEPGQWVSARILHGRKGIYAYQVQVLTPDTVTTGDAPPTPVDRPLPRNLLTLVAERLHEKNSSALFHIRRLYEHLGTDIIGEMIAETERIEAEGGMLFQDGSGRRRAPGGVFLFLAKRRLSHEEWARIFPPKPQTNPQPQNPPRPKTTPASAPAPAPVVEKITWDTRAVLIDTVREGQGIAQTVRIMVIGRPTSVVERGNTVILTLTHNGPLLSAPKGVPIPPVMPTTTYTVYVGAKQWRGVAEAMKNPEDELIMEGALTWDAEQQAIAVYTTKISSKLAQRATRATPPTTPTPAESPPT